MFQWFLNHYLLYCVVAPFVFPIMNLVAINTSRSWRGEDICRNVFGVLQGIVCCFGMVLIFDHVDGTSERIVLSIVFFFWNVFWFKLSADTAH